MQNRDPNCATGNCYGDDMIEDEKFERPDGTIIRGISAMFANRMKKLNAQLGFDIFISTNEIDREAQAFISLLKECQESASLTDPNS
jgi:hypothetical protein